MAGTPDQHEAARIVHVTTVHRPFDVRIFHKQCRSLADAGFQVTLIQQGEAEQVVDGVRILPLPTYRSRLARMTRGVWRATRLARAARPDVVHFHDAEFIWGGLLLKLAGKRVVYDVHEDVAKDLHDKAYLPAWSLPPLKLAVRLFEGLARLCFDRIAAATNAIAARFPPRSVTLIRNTPIIGELASDRVTPFGERSRNVVYVGGLAPFNGIAQMLAAMAEIPGEAGIRLTLGGGFPSEADETTARSSPGWDKVDYFGWVERGRIADLFGDARAGLVVYQPTPNIMECEPNKFFELLSAGLPLIASDIPIWRRFIEAYGCGLVVDSRDPAAIAGAVRYLVDHPEEAQAMGERGRAAILTDYNWTIDSAALVAMYRGLVPRLAA